MNFKGLFIHPAEREVSEDFVMAWFNEYLRKDKNKGFMSASNLQPARDSLTPFVFEDFLFKKVSFLIQFYMNE